MPESWDGQDLEGPSGIMEPWTGHLNNPPVLGGFHLQNWGRVEPVQ